MASVAGVAGVAAAIGRVLGEVAEEAARASGFARRRSKLGGAVFVRALVLGFLHDPGASLSELCHVAAGLGAAVSPQALDQRLNAAGAECLRRVLEAAAREAVAAAEPAAIPLLGRFAAVEVEDTSVVALPDALEAEWPGCGERTGKARAALKLHLRHDLLGGGSAGPRLTDGRVHDAAGPLAAEPSAPGTLRLRDLGYFSLAAFRAEGEAGGFWLSRYKVGTAILDPAGARLAPAAWLRGQGPTLDAPVLLGAAERLPCRLLAIRVPQEVVDERRRKLREAARREGKAPSGEKLALCAWTLLATNCPPAVLSLDEALALARARWQVELVFKRWKLDGGLERWRSARPAAILCEVYAKLLGALVAQWAVLALAWRFPDKSLVKLEAAVRLHAPLFWAALGGLLPLADALAFLARPLLGPAGRIATRASRTATFQRLLHPPHPADVDLAA